MQAMQYYPLLETCIARVTRVQQLLTAVGSHSLSVTLPLESAQRLKHQQLCTKQGPCTIRDWGITGIVAGLQRLGSTAPQDDLGKVCNTGGSNPDTRKPTAGDPDAGWYLGDEVDPSEDRSKALLEKLRQQAKERQLQSHGKAQEGKEVTESSNVEKVADIATTKHLKVKPKKRKKSQIEEIAAEVENPTCDSDPEDYPETVEVKAKKPRKKKISKEEQEENICLEAAESGDGNVEQKSGTDQETVEVQAKKSGKKKISKEEHKESVYLEAAQRWDGNLEQKSATGQETIEVQAKKPRKKKISKEEQEENNCLEAAQRGDGNVEQKSGTDPNSILLGGFETKPVQKVLPVLPQWLAYPNLVQKDVKDNLVPIHDFPGLHPKLLKKLEANKVKSFFPVQAEVIPAILDSCSHSFLLGRGGFRPRDICVSAPTGSGKTLAFVVPIVQSLLQRVVCEVRALVMLPTKELAQQVCKVFNIYVDGTGLKVVLLAGQKSFSNEQESLVIRKMSGFSSLADILVCTPGRLVDHIQQTEGFSLRHLRFLVIDEADRMIDRMNQDWLHHVTKAVFKSEPGARGMLFTRREPIVPTAANYCQGQVPLQKLLFSATLTHNPEKLQQLGLYQPWLFTSIYRQPKLDTADSVTESPSSGHYSLPDGLTHYYIPCTLSSKPLILLHFLLTLRFSRVLCFTNSRESSHRLFLLIKLFGGITVAEFSSRLSPGERRKTLKDFEQGKLQLLISTDATARGIDTKEVKCVINYDAPQYIRVYIHRVGRTARAGKAGLAFTMLLKIQEQRYINMLKEAGVPQLQKQLVKSENLRHFEQRYEEALSQLQRVVKKEHAQKR